MTSQLSDFQDAAQSGQELSAETLRPAEILIAGFSDPITCATGALNLAGESLGMGGMLPDTPISFRVRRILFSTPPAIGGLLQWRVPGELAYRATMRIESIIDRPNHPALILGCVNCNK